MKTKLLLSENILFPMLIFGFFFTFFTLSFDLENFGISLIAGKILSFVGLLFNFVAGIVLIIDVFKNDLSTKYLWTFGFLIFTPIVGYFYLRNRETYLLR